MISLSRKMKKVKNFEGVFRCDICGEVYRLGCLYKKGGREYKICFNCREPVTFLNKRKANKYYSSSASIRAIPTPMGNKR